MHRIIAYLLIAIPLLFGSTDAGAAPAAIPQSKTATAKSKKKTSGKNQAAKSRSTTKSAGSKKASSTGKQSARSAAEVKKARQQNASRIKQTREQITLNTRETEQRLNQLNLLEGEIEETNAAIKSQSATLDGINRRINLTSDSIKALDDRLDAITAQYVAAIRRSQAHRRQTSPMAFIFSSESFSQAWRRMRSLRQFNRWRDSKSREINTLKASLDNRRKALSALKTKSDRQLAELNTSRATLVSQQAKTSTLVERLRREGGELKQIMAQRQREAASLDAELDRIIAEEARRQEELRLKKEAEERRAREEAERIARQKEEERIAREAREAEEAKKAEAERVAAQKKADEAKAEAERQRQAEAAAKSEAEKKAAQKARKEAEQEQKRQRQAAEKAEKERDKAQREAEKKAREEARQRAKSGKPVAHTGKNNGRGDAGPGGEAQTSASSDAPKLNRKLPDGVESVAKAAAIPSGVGFDASKGKLPFPLEGRYTIVKHFGRQKHPTLPHVETNNSGIDIATSRGAAVRAVFDGEVSAVFRPDGYNNVIVLRHGDRYMTVYANLATINVATGQKVKAGQTLGTLYADSDSPEARSVLHFEIRNRRAKENPELWLAR